MCFWCIQLKENMLGRSHICCVLGFFNQLVRDLFDSHSDQILEGGNDEQGKNILRKRLIRNKVQKKNTRKETKVWIHFEPGLASANVSTGCVQLPTSWGHPPRGKPWCPDNDAGEFALQCFTVRVGYGMPVHKLQVPKWQKRIQLKVKENTRSSNIKMGGDSWVWV